MQEKYHSCSTEICTPRKMKNVHMAPKDTKQRSWLLSVYHTIQNSSTKEIFHKILNLNAGAAEPHGT